MTDSTIKMADFSTIPIGDKFFTSKQTAQDDGVYYTKTASLKNTSGAWTNAKGPISLIFVRYDTRVWIRK